jgi:hypothetical protein
MLGRMRRWALAAVLAAALAGGVAAALAASSVFDPGRPGSLFGRRMARAEVVVVAPGGAVHDYRLDQGRLRLNRGVELVVRERDGTLQVVPVSPTAQVTLNGSPTSLASLRRGLWVLTVRDGDAAASVVRARSILP